MASSDSEHRGRQRRRNTSSHAVPRRRFPSAAADDQFLREYDVKGPAPVGPLTQLLREVALSARSRSRSASTVRARSRPVESRYQYNERTFAQDNAAARSRSQSTVRERSRSVSTVRARSRPVESRYRYNERIFEQDTNSAAEMANNNAFPPLDTSMNNAPRNAASPTTPHPGSAVNGNGAGPANYMATLPVGHQQDLNFLYAQIQELGGILRSNREKVNVITQTAEEVARRANGALGDGEGMPETERARMREIERELAKAKQLVEAYKHEQKENTNLIAMYEDALGTATEQIRNYCGGIEERFLAQRRHYNNLLQQEKDDHLQSRLEKDHWFAQTLKVCEMIRTAYRLRTEEWGEEYTIISALQAEVRCYRRLLGMEVERPEDETGWPYLKDLPLNDQA
ncbi:hypothetical protein PV11_06081 [Exophiala sideris]|uniref:Uncharacterized protein n=1 Tax=Exophiala sideris TaxID=1016849 RepID=A0A0D1ZBI6_9EURO|nr:hypothetical protein PV11_06081 [Exophiala sideris]